MNKLHQSTYSVSKRFVLLIVVLTTVAGIGIALAPSVSAAGVPDPTGRSWSCDFIGLPAQGAGAGVTTCHPNDNSQTWNRSCTLAPGGGLSCSINIYTGNGTNIRDRTYTGQYLTTTNASANLPDGAAYNSDGTPGGEVNEIAVGAANGLSVTEAGTQGITDAATAGLSVVLAPVAVLAWLIFKIGGFLLGIAGMLFNFTMGALVFEFSKYLGNTPGMLVAWRILRDFGNIALLFGFVYMGITTILDLHSYPWSKALPKLIIAAVLLNFSLFAAEAVVDSTNVLAAVLYDNTSTGGTCNLENGLQCFVNTGIAGVILEKINITSVYALDDSLGDNVLTFVNNVVQYTGNPLPYILQFIGLALLVTTAAVVLFAGAFMLLSRAIILAFLMVTSPIGIAGMAVPQLEKLAKDWWSKLINQALFAPVFLLLILVSLKMTDGIATLVQPGQGLASAISATDGINTGPLLLFGLIIGFLLGSLMLANKLGIYGADLATSTASRAVYGTLGFMGRRTFGTGGQILARKLTPSLQRSGAGRLVLGGLRKMGEGNYDLTSSSAGKALAKIVNIDVGHAQHGGIAHIEHQTAEDLEKMGRKAKNTGQEISTKAKATAAVKEEANRNKMLNIGFTETDKRGKEAQTKAKAEVDALTQNLASNQAARQSQIEEQQRKVNVINRVSNPETFSQESALLEEMKLAQGKEAATMTADIRARQAALDAEKKFYDNSRKQFSQDIDVSNTELTQRLATESTLKRDLDPQRLFAKALIKELRANPILRATAAGEGYSHAAHNLEAWADKSPSDRAIADLTETIKETSRKERHDIRNVEHAFVRTAAVASGSNPTDDIGHPAGSAH